MEKQDARIALIRAINAAQKAVSATVFKARRNKEQNYSFVGHEDVLRACRDALVQNGLVLTVVGMEGPTECTARSKSGERQIWAWTVSYEVAHVDGGSLTSSVRVTTIPNDKAAFVANTAADRMAMLRLMRLAGSDDEDPEHDGGGYDRTTGEVRKAGDVFADARAALESCLDFGMLVEWARALTELRATADQKAPLWTAFGDRCKALKLNPKDVADAARGKAA